MSPYTVITDDTSAVTKNTESTSASKIGSSVASGSPVTYIMIGNSENSSPRTVSDTRSGDTDDVISLFILHVIIPVYTLVLKG